MRRIIGPALMLLAGLAGGCERTPTAASNVSADAQIDALARNLSEQAANWRDDIDNQEADAAAQNAQQQGNGAGPP